MQIARGEPQRFAPGGPEGEKLGAEETGAASAFFRMHTADAKPFASVSSVKFDVQDTDGADGKLFL